MRWREIAPPLLASACFLGAWQGLVPSLGVPEYVLPAPLRVLTEGWNVRRLLGDHLIVTATEAYGGLLLGISVAIAIGVGIARVGILRRTLFPFVVASNAIPIVAVAPLISLWFGYGLASKVLVAAFLSFFPTCVATYRGLEQSQRDYLDLMLVFGGRPSDSFVLYEFPNALPSIFSGLRLSATFAAIGAIVAELAGANRGLGYAMLQASYSLQTARLMVYLIVACALGLAMYASVVVVEHFCRPLRFRNSQ